MKSRFLGSIGFVALGCLAAQAALAQDSITRKGRLEAGDGQLDSGEYVDEYWIEGVAGDLLDISVTSDEFDSYLIVRGTGDTVFENDDASEETVNSRILERLPASGRYSILVTSYEPGETGFYSLSGTSRARPIDSSLSSREAGSLGNGDERLESGEFSDKFTFAGEAGDLVEIGLTSDEFDSYLILRGPGGAGFENDDGEPGNSNSHITATLPATGEYMVLATSYGPGEAGSYLLQSSGAELVAAPVRGLHQRLLNLEGGEALGVGSPVSGALGPSDRQTESGEYFDAYMLAAEPGARLTLRLQSDEIDTYLVASGSDGSEFVNDDDPDAGGATDSRFDVMIPASGSMAIAATSYSPGEKGAYTLLAEPFAGSRAGNVVAVNNGAVSLGEEVEGVLLPAGEDTGQRVEAGYVLQATADQVVDISLSSSEFDPVLRIEGPNGFRIENDDDPGTRTLDSRIRATLPDTGTYRLVVTSYAQDARGGFVLSTGKPTGALGPAAETTRAIALGDKVYGALATGDESFETGELTDLYRFEGQRGQRLDITMESAEIDTYLLLYLPDGNEVRNDDGAGMEDTNSRISITLPQDGTYEIAASSYAVGEQGSYSLNIATADQSLRTLAPTPDDAQVYALIVGVSDYERLSTLDLVDQDALKLSQTLTAAGVLAPESVTMLNADATRESFTAAFESIASSIGPEDLLLVFFSGHGDKIEGLDTELDGSSETIELFDAPLHDYELAQMFESVDARTLLVIDACFSGGFDNVIDQSVDRMGIFSSDSDVLSLVAQKYQAGGYVSLLLRQALEGEADTNADHAITAGELSEFMRREFYRLALSNSLDAGGENFLGEETLGYQHMIVDRGGDGMPYGQVLMYRPVE